MALICDRHNSKPATSCSNPSTGHENRPASRNLQEHFGHKRVDRGRPPAANQNTVALGWDVTTGGARDEPILRAGCRREAMRGVHECKRADHGHRPDCRGKDWSLQGNREVGREGTYPVSRLSASDNDVGSKIGHAGIGWHDERAARRILRSNARLLRRDPMKLIHLRYHPRA